MLLAKLRYPQQTRTLVDGDAAPNQYGAVPTNTL